MSRPLIELTPDQRAELERQKSADPALRRVSLKLTDEQQRRRQEAVDIEQAGKEENIAAYRRMRAAESEPTLSGDLRRAIKASGRHPKELAEEIGVAALKLDAFRSGDETLPSDVIDRLVLTLGMTLAHASVQESDRSSDP